MSALECASLARGGNRRALAQVCGDNGLGQVSLTAERNPLKQFISEYGEPLGLYIPGLGLGGDSGSAVRGSWILNAVFELGQFRLRDGVASLFPQTGFTSWWVLSQKTQPRKKKKKERKDFTCNE